MIDSMAGRLAESIKRMNPDRTSSVEVMTFSLIILLNALATVVLCAAVGFVSGKPAETVIVLLGFAFLRFFSGGFHLKSADACVVFSAIVVSVIPHIPLPGLTLPLNIASLALVAWLAPDKVENQIRVSEKHRVWFKLISVLIVGSNLFIGSETLAKAFMAQALLLLPSLRR